MLEAHCSHAHMANKRESDSGANLPFSTCQILFGLYFKAIDFDGGFLVSIK